MEGHRHYFFISHQHKSSIDFQLYYAIRTIRDHQLDGQYFDLAQPRAAAGYAGRMTSDFGRESFYMPIFGYREFSKRFYIAATEINPGFLIIQHAVIPTGISSAYSVSSGGEHLKQFFGSGHRTHRIDEQGRTVLASDPAEFDPENAPAHRGQSLLRLPHRDEARQAAAHRQQRRRGGGGGALRSERRDRGRRRRMGFQKRRVWRSDRLRRGPTGNRHPAA